MVVRGALVALLLIATGCGEAEPESKQPSGGTFDLRDLCPGIHLAYDDLVASNPASQVVLVDQLKKLRVVADADARDALDPVIDAAKALEAAGRGPNFSTAQDGVYQAVVGLDARCRDVGSLILH